MENMDKELTVQKLGFIDWPKIPKMLPILSAQIVCQSPKVWNFDEKMPYWVTVVRDCTNQDSSLTCFIYILDSSNSSSFTF